MMKKINAVIIALLLPTLTACYYPQLQGDDGYDSSDNPAYTCSSGDQDQSDYYEPVQTVEPDPVPAAASPVVISNPVRPRPTSGTVIKTTIKTQLPGRDPVISRPRIPVPGEGGIQAAKPVNNKPVTRDSENRNVERKKN
jgi:hypothetical protein